jgi:hypothetical protein
LYQLEVFEEFEVTKGVIRIRKATKNRETTEWPKEIGQKNEERSTKQYT